VGLSCFSFDSSRWMFAWNSSFPGGRRTLNQRQSSRTINPSRFVIVSGHTASELVDLHMRNSRDRRDEGLIHAGKCDRVQSRLCGRFKRQRLCWREVVEIHRLVVRARDKHVTSSDFNNLPRLEAINYRSDPLQACYHGYGQPPASGPPAEVYDLVELDRELLDRVPCCSGV
jgi:hypothetical protein